MSNDIPTAESLDVLSLTNWNDSATRHRLSRLAQVARTTGSAVIITDIEGVTVWVNDAFTRITGYSFAEAVGCTPGHLLQGPETESAEVARIRTALHARQSVAAVLTNYAKDGHKFWVGMKIDPLLNAQGEVDGFMALEADITDRHEQHQTVEQLKRRFDMATRAARIGVFERDTEFEILWWSEVTCEIFGLDSAASKPTNEVWLGLIHPDDRERIREEVKRLAQSLGVVNLQYRIIRPDGEIRHVQSLGSPVDCQGGPVERISGIVIDVTERVRAEERAEALESRLREKFHQAGMAEIATGVLHNVGNVLNSLGAANTTARRELKSLRLDRLEQATTLLRSNRDTLAVFLSNDERGRHIPDYLPALSDHIVRSSSAIQAELDTTEKLLQHLRDIVSAQQEIAGVGGRCELLRVGELVDTALQMHSAELAHIEVVREYEELPLIMTDRHKLLQIVVNLISNARDAVQEGATHPHRIVVILARDGDHVRLTVKDSGIGMSADVLSRLWRFGFTTKKAGHGFGLHNSANTAREIGATLEGYSEGLGRGSSFVLCLPIRQS